MIDGRKQKNKGFTIMETLVAIFILLLSITGPLSFAQSGLRAAFVSRDQVTAFYLAQDAIEYIKNVRDNNLIDIVNNTLEKEYWLNDVHYECFGDAGCTVDTTTADGEFDGCTIGSAPVCDYPLKYNSDEYTYGFNGDQESIFFRKIVIREINPAQEAEVTITIRWDAGGTIGEREIVVRENIFNWLSI